MIGFSSISLGMSTQIKSTLNQEINTEKFEQITVPIWPVGTEWVYDVDFSYLSDDDYSYLSINLNLGAVDCLVTDDTEYYELEVSSPFRGNVIFDSEGLPKININFKNTDLSALIHLHKNNLSIKDFSLIINGRITINLIPFNLNVELMTNATPSLELIHYPFSLGNTWRINSSYLDLSGFITLPGIATLIPNVPEEFEFDYGIALGTMDAECNQLVNLSTVSGIYPTYNISYEDEFFLFFSPVLGNVLYISIPPAKSDYNDYSLSFALRSTNYVMPGSPNKPNPPTGSTEGKPNQPYEYTAVTLDSENDQVFYSFDWGDGTLSPWIGPVDSGETINASKTWDARGTYSVRVKAKDIYGNQSPWSDPLPVTMDKSKDLSLISRITNWLEMRFSLFLTFLDFFNLTYG
jgi:hypothetical protein